MTSEFQSAHLSALVQALPEPALVIAEPGNIVAANQHAKTIFGSKAEGEHITAVLRTPAVLQAVNDAFMLGKHACVSHSVRNPVQRSFDVYTAPLGQVQGGVRIALLVLRDLTYEEQIERMRTDFVANASHELRTPLASLTGFIETLQGAAKNDAKAKDQFLKLMKAQADRMAQLIDDLLSLSRIEISEHVAPTGAADLVHIAKQSRDLLTNVAADSKCELRFDLPQSLPVTGDEHQLSQVVHNLIENAIKYAGNEKHVDVTGRLLDEVAILSVRDYGAGIAAHHLPRLTERFYRVNVQDSRNRGGTGLGLAIAKHIINRHRGKLLIQSDLGQGSTFSIHLPVLK